MVDAIRSEWIKLSTVSVNKVLWAIGIAFTIVVVTLASALSDEIFDVEDLTDMISFVSILSALLFGVVATISTTSEFNYNTIRPTFAAQPVRLKPLLAKLVVVVAATTILTVLILAVSWVVGINVVGDDGYFPFWSLPGGEASPARTALFGQAMFTIGVAILGIGLGLLIRHTAAAVALLLLWPLLIENTLVRVLFNALDKESWNKFLPFTQGLTLGVIDRGDEELMARLPAGLYFYAWVIGITILGLFRTERADA